MNDSYEILSLSISNQNLNFIISGFYRPPSSSISDFNDFLIDSFLPSVASFNTVICGDFNINLLNPSNSLTTNNFINSMIGFNFYPLIDKPTRYSYDENNFNGTIIDHIWMNFKPHDDLQSAVVECDISDHRPILFHFKNTTEETKQHFTYRNFKNETSKNHFKNQIRQCDFTNGSNDPNILGNDFCNKIYSIFNACYPLKNSNRN